MDNTLLDIVVSIWLLVGGYFSLRQRYFLPQYRWRLVLVLDALCAVLYLWAWHSRFSMVSFVACAAVIAAASVGLLLFEYRFLQRRRRPGGRSVEDTFG